MTGRSLRKAIDAHCRDCGACDAGANWREHVSCCAVLTCSLWPVRPMSRSVPDWLASRDQDALPDGWCKLPIEDALAEVRNPAFGCLRDTEKLSSELKPRGSGAEAAAGSNGATSAPVPVLGECAR